MSGLDHQLISQYHQYLDAKEAFLDTYIDTGSDHELFVASYIHGHFSVIAASLLNAMNEPTNKTIKLIDWQEQTKLLLRQSIDKAIANNELSNTDACDVVLMREALFQQ